MELDQLHNEDFQCKKAECHADYFQGENRKLDNFRAFTDLYFVLVCCCCCNKLPQTQALQTTQMYSLIVLELRSLISLR